ncbi:MAG: hypothetical protein Q7S06_00605 [Nanoarchaeota archaeon]|nr:hypothetical protein [Nanoarchaeota archaeon]
MTEQDIKKIKEMMMFLVKQSKKFQDLDTTERKIYDLTGVKKQSEIVKLLKTSSKTVTKIWKDLENEGLLIKEGKLYRKVV